MLARAIDVQSPDHPQIPDRGSGEFAAFDSTVNGAIGHDGEAEAAARRAA
jgi:hypothetical protein